jgi:nitrogen fixation NifU-like protein
MQIKNTDIVKELALPPVKIHCSVLAEDAIRAAIGDWKKKNGVENLAEATHNAAESVAAQ